MPDAAFAFQHFVAFVGSPPLPEITDQVFLRYAAQRMAGGSKLATLRREADPLRRAWRSSSARSRRCC